MASQSDPCDYGNRLHLNENECLFLFRCSEHILVYIRFDVGEDAIHRQFTIFFLYVTD